MPKRLPISSYIAGVLAGDRVVLSRAITLVESRLAADRQLAGEVLAGCQHATGKAFRLGITGVPGVGKSTFIDAFGMHLLEAGKKVAVLAVDPSSQVTRGSILGDKTRMVRLSLDKRAYIRPSPARETLGGVTRATRETILLCEAAGFDTILVETVGVGQSETAVHSMVDFFLLLMLAGAGDELQGIKKGIMEMADGIVINKSDGENQLAARKARAEYQKALHLFPLAESGWSPKVLTASGLVGEGMSEILGMLASFQLEMEANGFLQRNRSRQAVQWMHDTIRFQLGEAFFAAPLVAARLETIEQEVGAGKVPPTLAASRLIDLYLHRPAQGSGD